MENTKIMRELMEIFAEGNMEGTLTTIERLMEIISHKGVKGKAPDMSREIGSPFMNVIPGSVQGNCKSELMVICFDRDNLHDRLREMIYTSGIYCNEENKMVAFITTKWSSETYDKHKKAVEILERNGKRFVFVLLNDNKAIRIN